VTNDQIKAIYLAAGFKEKDQGDGRMDLNPYVYDAARALLATANEDFAPLAWTEPAPPDNDCNYDHVVATCPFGQYSIEWKGWKPADSYCLYFCGEYVDTQSQLPDAKYVAARHFANRVAACKPFTYSTMQATNCAGCGQHKHTPLRIDAMGGYVCLTCIDKRLEGLLAEESARGVEKDWWGCQEVADLPAVHEALMAFSHDPTGDNGTHAVKAVIEALGASPAQAGKPGAAEV